MVDGSGLENRQGASPRGFESHPLRQTELRICDCRLWIWRLRQPNLMYPWRMVRIQISLEPKEAGWLKRLAGIVGRLVRKTSAEGNRSTASGKTSALNKGGTISSRFPFA